MFVCNVNEHSWNLRWHHSQAATISSLPLVPFYDLSSTPINNVTDKDICIVYQLWKGMKCLSECRQYFEKQSKNIVTLVNYYSNLKKLNMLRFNYKFTASVQLAIHWKIFYWYTVPEFSTRSAIQKGTIDTNVELAMCEVRRSQCEWNNLRDRSILHSWSTVWCATVHKTDTI